MSIPILIFTYNRPEHTQKTIESLLKNPLAKESNLFVFNDGWRSENDKDLVLETREYLEKVIGFKTVTLHFSAHNMGCDKSTIAGVTKVFESSDKVIVLEDDLLVSPYFLEYMHACLNKYEKADKIFSIGAWAPPTFKRASSRYPYDVAAIPRTCSTGWGTWKNRWESVDWQVSSYPEILASKELQDEFDLGGRKLFRMLEYEMNKGSQVWDVRFTYDQFRQRRLSLYPLKTYVFNIGFDGTGEHCKAKKVKQQTLNRKNHILRLPDNPEIDKKCLALFQRQYDRRIMPFRVLDRARKALIKLFK